MKTSLKPLSNYFAFVLLFLLSSFAQAALELAVEANPDPAQPGEALNVEISITNPDSLNRSNVVIQMEYPVGLASLSETLISDGGGCIGASCEETEFLIWNFAELPAGTGITVSLPPRVAAATLPGTVIEFAAEATDSSGTTTAASETVEVVNDRTLELVLSELELDPVIPGGELTYVLSFGHTASSAVAPDTVLELPVPDGLSFNSATDGGSLVGDTVQWTLGTLQPGEVGERRATFTVDAGQGFGTAIRAEAVVRNGEITRADAVTRVEEFVPLTVAIEANANPAQPGDVLTVELTVTNTTAFNRSDVILQMRYPVGLASLSETLISDGGGCIGASCEETEFLIWNFAELPAGTGITVSLPPMVDLNLPLGSLVEFVAFVEDATARSRAIDVVRIGDEFMPPDASVPNVVGLPQSDAEAAIIDAGFTVGTITTQTDATVPAGDVISQDPVGGTIAVLGSAVNLVISLGPDTAEVPNVVGQSQADAEAAIVAAGFTVGTITTQTDATIPAGDVISQDPIGGTIAVLGSTVNLVISLGPDTAEVPDVVGQPQADAEAAIVAAGFTVGTITTQTDATVPAGDVISQDPAGGTTAVLGSAVNLVVSTGPIAAQCDVNADGSIDRFDIGLIFAARNTSATNPAMDPDGDGVVTVNDGRLCVLQCTTAGCAP